MDDRRFDRFARKFATSNVGRRGIIAAFVGAAVWSQARNADSAQPACAGDGAYCGMWQPCCPGTVCTVYATNPNSGTCRPGTDTTGAGMVMLGPTGQVITAQVIATSTPRPTKVPKATKTPKPTSTPKSRTNLTPTGNWNVSASLSCNTTPEETRITNIGENPLMLSQIKSVMKDVVYDTNGDVSNADIVITKGQTLVVRSNFLTNEPLTDTREFYSKSKKEKARILVRKLNGDGTLYSDSAGDMEIRAFCNGDPSVLVSERSIAPTATPTPTAPPVTPTPSADSSETRNNRRKSPDDRKRRKGKKTDRANRD